MSTLLAMSSVATLAHLPAHLRLVHLACCLVVLQTFAAKILCNRSPTCHLHFARSLLYSEAWGKLCAINNASLVAVSANVHGNDCWHKLFRSHRSAQLSKELSGMNEQIPKPHWEYPEYTAQRGLQSGCELLSSLASRYPVGPSYPPPSNQGCQLVMTLQTDIYIKHLTNGESYPHLINTWEILRTPASVCSSSLSCFLISARFSRNSKLLED